MSTSPDDLSKLERQLMGCRPAATGLDADAMLFAAGQAVAARPNAMRLAWPVTACGLAVACIFIAGGWRSERTQRIELASRLSRPVDSVELPNAAPLAQPPLPGSYWSVRRQIEKDGDAWMTQANRSPGSPTVPSGNPSTMRAWPSKSVEP